MGEPAEPIVIGSVRWRSVLDGIATYEKETLFTDVQPSELDDATAGLLNADGFLPVPYRPSVLVSGDQLVLVDAGTGPDLAKEWGEPTGRLSESLAAAAVDPGSITMVFISHAHPDHIGGLIALRDGERTPAFPSARHLISRVEHEFWTSGSEEFPHMAELARQHLGPLADAGLLEPFDGEPEIAPGIRVVPAPGHTPGHSALSITAGDCRGLWGADALLGDLSLQHVEWSSRLEVDRPKAVATRRALLDRAIEEGAVFDGYHIRGPGLVQRQGDGYRLARLPA